MNVGSLSSSAWLVYECLKDEIVFGVRHPRERLIEAELAAKFQKDRRVVREALARLELEGLVQRTPNRGAAIPDLQPSEVEQLYDVRICFETEAVMRLKFPFDPEVIQRLVEIQNRHSEAVANLDRRNIFSSNNFFHHEIYSQCKNEYLIECISLMAKKALLVRFHPYQQEAFLKLVCEEHWQMVEAIKNEDREQLAIIVRQHVPRAKDGYILAYRQREAMQIAS